MVHTAEVTTPYLHEVAAHQSGGASTASLAVHVDTAAFGPELVDEAHPLLQFLLARCLEDVGGAELQELHAVSAPVLPTCQPWNQVCKSAVKRELFYVTNKSV